MDIDDLTRKTIAEQHATIERLERHLAAERAKIDAAILVMSDDRMPVQSRINDARSILSR